MYASQQVCKIYVLRLFGIGIRSDVMFLNHFMEKPDKFSKRLQKSSSLLAVSFTNTSTYYCIIYGKCHSEIRATGNSLWLSAYGGGGGVREIVEREQVDARHSHRVGAQQRSGGGRVRAGHHEVRAPVQEQHSERAVRRRRVRVHQRGRRGVMFRAHVRARVRRQRVAARRERRRRGGRGRGGG